MSNRVYTSRLDFRPGWVMRQQRYGVPGAPAEMYNCQLDLLAEGALRQTWGAAPFAFRGTTGPTGQYLAATVSGRRPGICHIDSIKAGDAGEQDTIIVVDQQENATTASQTDSVFYWITAPDNSNRQSRWPHGKSFAATVTSGRALSYYVKDLVYTMGYDIDDGTPFTFSQIFGTMTLAAWGTTGFKLTSPSSIGATYTATDVLLFTNSTTGVSYLTTFTTVVQPYPETVMAVNDAHFIQLEAPFEDFTVLHTQRRYFQGLSSGSPTPDKDLFAATASSYSQAGEDFWTDTFSIRMRGGYPYPPEYWESDSNWAQYPTEDSTGTPSLIIGTPTFTHWMPVGPVKINQTGVNNAARSAALRAVNTVSDVSQPKTGPLGIWRSATMNGKAYFFNGYSGTAFSIDIYTPTSTDSIGLDRPAFTLTAIGTYTKPGSDNKNEPRKGPYRYWIAEIDENGFESGISENYLQFTNDKYRTEGILIGTSTTASTDAITPASNTQSFMRLYRSFRNDYAPYHLADLDAYNTPYFEDNSADDSLGDPPWTHGDAPPYDAFSPVVYYDRLWLLGTRPGVTGAKRTTLFWSDINEPESFWWDGNWANVYGDDGDEVTAMIRDKTGLLIFKNNHTYLMSGRSPDEISFNEITVEDSDTGVGCPHQNAVVATDFGVFFYWNRGVYRYFQGLIQKVSGPIAPLLEGREDIFTVNEEDTWPYYGAPYDWSVTMDYDNVTEVIYFGCQGDFPFNKARVAGENSDELTCLLDVKNARWIGQYTYHLGLIRRVNVDLYDKWYGTPNTYSGGILMGALMSDVWSGANKSPTTDDRLGFSTHHPLVILPGTAAMGNCPVYARTKFRPIIGNLGPYSSKRFLYADYLVDEQGIGQGTSNSALLSTLYLDGSTTGSSSTLTVGGGAVYSDQIRHTLGHIGAEIEAEIVFDPTKVGDTFRLFEYSIGWQNLGREKAERPGAAPASPPGGPGWTSPPVSLGGGSGGIK